MNPAVSPYDGADGPAQVLNRTDLVSEANGFSAPSPTHAVDKEV